MSIVSWLSSLPTRAPGVGSLMIGLCALPFGGCQERAPTKRELATWVEQLYGPTLVLVLESAERDGSRRCYFSYSRFPGDRTPVREREAREKRAQQPGDRLVLAGTESLPYVYAGLFDQRRIPREWMVGFFKPEDEEILQAIRVCDKAAAVFSMIVGEVVTFVDMDRNGIPHRLPPSEREQVLARAYRIVLDSQSMGIGRNYEKE